MKFAVFISSGIGNAIFLIPLIKELQKHGEVHAICDSPYFSERIFERLNTQLFDKVTDLRSTSKIVVTALKSVSKFDHVYLDYFAATRKNLAFSTLIGRNVHTLRIPRNLPNIFKNRIRLHRMVAGAHESTQYLRYFKPDTTDLELCQTDFNIEPFSSNRALPTNYITLQPGAGNNLTPWKTWPLDNWVDLTKKFIELYPEIKILVLGDSHDSHMEPYLTSLGSNVQSYINNTQLSEIPSLIQGALIHIGGDSGLLHIAGAVGVKTITIAGGSDPEIFGWHKIDRNRHYLIQHKLPCHPCYRHYLPNQSRTIDPAKCPDFKCIRDVTVNEVVLAIESLLNNKP